MRPDKARVGGKPPPRGMAFAGLGRGGVSMRDVFSRKPSESSVDSPERGTMTLGTTIAFGFAIGALIALVGQFL